MLKLFAGDALVETGVSLRSISRVITVIITQELTSRYESITFTFIAARTDMPDAFLDISLLQISILTTHTVHYHR